MDEKLARLVQKYSLQRWLAGVFLAFVALVIISVGLTFWGLDAQRQDAQIINLAGRQRMLVQEMASLALEYQQEGEPQHRLDLLTAAASFSQTLTALRQGGVITDYEGRILTLPPAPDPSLTAALDDVRQAWQSFDGQQELLAAAGQSVSPSVVQRIVTSAPELVDRADRVVRVYEALSAAKIARLHWIQVGFLVCGLALLGLGWWLIRVSIVRPLRQLDRSARQIGAGNLETPLQPGGAAEIRDLGNTLDVMRSQLLDSSLELKAWVNTLEQRVTQRTRELAALAAVSRDISSHLNIREVLKSVTDQAQRLLGSEIAFLCLLDDQGQSLRLDSAVGPETAILKSAAVVQPEINTQVLAGRTAVPCGVQTCPGFCQILHPKYRVSHLAVRLQTGNEVIGALCVGGSQPAMFGRESAQALTQLAGIASVALENSRLYEEAEHRAALEARQHIAAEIHDGLLQTLSYLRWMVGLSGQQLSQGDVSQALATFRNIDRAEQQAEVEMRRAIASLQDDSPVHLALQEQFVELVAETKTWPAPEVKWENKVSQPITLPRAEGEQVLRVAREALLNAYHHSQGQVVRVCFEEIGTELALSVEDDGVGFEPDLQERRPGDRAHFGLTIMQARAARLGGRVTVESASGKGTCVTLRWSPGATGGCKEEAGR